MHRRGIVAAFVVVLLMGWVVVGGLSFFFVNFICEIGGRFLSRGGKLVWV